MKIKDLVTEHGDVEVPKELLEQLGIKEKTHPLLWKPSDNEYYYLVSSYGQSERVRCSNDIVDFGRVSMGNTFKTEEEAKKEIECRKAGVECLREIARLNDGWKPKWEHDTSQYKFVVIFDHSRYVCSTSSSRIHKSHHDYEYLKSRELAEQFIKTHGELWKKWKGVE